MKRFFFVGIEQSKTAIAHDWTWTDGHLAAKQLFRVLRRLNIDPIKDCQWGNISDKNILQRIGIFYHRSKQGIVIAMGARVDATLREHGINNHTTIYHPAARGKIRLKENYFRHVESRLPLQIIGLRR